MQDIRVGGKYKILNKIGSGSFGEIHKGLNLESNEEVAIKLENINSRHPQLIYESKLLKLLQGSPGIPAVHWFGTEGNYNIMVLDLLGQSLEDLFSVCGRRLSLKTTLMLADQMICRIEYVHYKSFIHRDIKPDNFLVGLNKRSSLVYIIDFGLAKKYKDPRTGRHIPYRDGKSLTGTARYASVNTHAGIEQSRRDDLESIGYVLIYFLKGTLPWQGIDTRNREEKYKRIFEIKSSTVVTDLCKGYPQEFTDYLNYSRSIGFEETPDYNYIKKLFKDLFVRLEYECDYNFDWVMVNEKRRSPVRHLKAEEEKRNSENLETKNQKSSLRPSNDQRKSAKIKKSKKSCIAF